MIYDTKLIRFRFAARKALAAIHWMVQNRPNVDLHTMLKACYFADKAQLNAINQPIFGATYRAMKFGPVPLEIYEMAKGEALWLAELNLDALPWVLDGYRLRLVSNSDPEMDVLSSTDFAEIKAGFDLSKSLNFDSRTALTHGFDWQAANLGIMKYEDMLADSSDKNEKILFLSESAPYVKL